MTYFGLPPPEHFVLSYGYRATVCLSAKAAKCRSIAANASCNSGR